MPPSLLPPLNCLSLPGTVANYGLVVSVVLAEMLLGMLKHRVSAWPEECCCLKALVYGGN